MLVGAERMAAEWWAGKQRECAERGPPVGKAVGGNKGREFVILLG